MCPQKATDGDLSVRRSGDSCGALKMTDMKLQNMKMQDMKMQDMKFQDKLWKSNSTSRCYFQNTQYHGAIGVITID